MDRYPGRIVGEIAGAVRTAFGLTRHHRLSDHLANSLQLYAAAQQHPALEEAASKLAQVVNLQAGQLLQVVTNRPRRWDWSTFVGGSVLTVPLAVLTWVLWVPVGLSRDGWGWAILVPLGLFTTMCGVITLQALFQRQAA